MQKTVETMINSHFSTDLYTYSRLEGGISNESYKVRFFGQNPSHETLVFTIFRDTSDWWKIEKESLIRDVLDGDPEVLIPKMYDGGYELVDGNETGFLIREFVEGYNLDETIESRLMEKERTQHITNLAQDLGYRIGTFHRNDNLTDNEIMGLNPAYYTNWIQHVLEQVNEESRKIFELSNDQGIGGISPAKIVQLLPGLHNQIGSTQTNLLGSSLSMSHGDARFANFIANSGENGIWQIKSLIDLEDVLVGDPEIDIAFIENWLYFSSYKNEFYDQKKDFLRGYNITRKISPNYPQKRLIYHALRSLSYLRTIFGLNRNNLLRKNPNIQTYVLKHFSILQSLERGYALEDLNIDSIV